MILVAQDTTYYGKDIYGKFMLSSLLKRLCRIRGLKWIRLMYTHPAHFTDELIKTIAKEKKICKYLDLPIQHTCDNILALMGRRVTGREISGLTRKIRRSIPGVVLRTSLIVGFPGESKKDFRRLLSFIEKERFERLGIFTYWAEIGTPANLMRGQVPEKVKRSRYQLAMRLQNRISEEQNKNKLNKVIEVMVDRITENGCVGRSFADAPEIDGYVVISSPNGENKEIIPGEVIRVGINGCSAYDLFGHPVT